MSETSVSPTFYGIETEYSCMLELQDTTHELIGACHSTDYKLGLYQEPRQSGARSVGMSALARAIESLGMYQNPNGMLSNGGRLYIDPSGFEYATPETTTAEEAVLRTFDGDTIMLDALNYLRTNDIIEGYQLNRRIVDHNRSSRGIHLNTMTSLSNDPTKLAKNWLATLNAVKGSMFGSGGLLVNRRGETEYHHSPRLSLTNRKSAVYMDYTKRPLVRYPFKTENSELGLSRIETVTSDALNFGWPLKASLVATNALVGLIEMGYGGMLPTLEDSVRSAIVVGRYGHEAKVLTSIGGAKLKPEHPQKILRVISEMELTIDDGEKTLSKESRQALGEIIDTDDKMGTDIYSVASRVESIYRQAAMKRRMEKGNNLGLDSETMCRYDYAWDLVGGGIAEGLRNRASGAVGWHGFSNVPNATAAKRMRTKPPQDTRAKVRGEVIRRAKERDQSTWAEIGISYKDRGDTKTTWEYMHPSETEIPMSITANLDERYP